MADVKITDLTALTSSVTGDFFVVVDISDTTDSVDGTTKKITLANIKNSLLVGGLNLSNTDITNVKLLEHQEEVDNGNSGSAETIDWGTGNFQKSTLSDNVTYTFTDPSGPCMLVLNLVQDATGSRTVTWGADVIWAGGSAPTISTAANAVDIIEFYYDGTNYYGSVKGLNYS